MILERDCEGPGAQRSVARKARKATRGAGQVKSIYFSCRELEFGS